MFQRPLAAAAAAAAATVVKWHHLRIPSYGLFTLSWRTGHAKQTAQLLTQ